MHLVLFAFGRPIITFAVDKFMAHRCHLKRPIRLDLERFAISPHLGRGTIFARLGVETTLQQCMDCANLARCNHNRVLKNPPVGVFKAGRLCQ